MAKIPLRTYVREIENLIERGEIEQAITHAKNILKTYPKHIDTYRLLGKAFLESQRYTQALDILQRVLSVIPDDFISHIGMSIIREDEGNLDQAIWHMERAYEVQPFNPAVQDELRRLYGRRDGVQPPKIRLTRGALVRMYARGELFPQAIAEIRAALAEDSQRPDLEVLLARLYYQSRQKIETIETCSRLLKRLPYCKEAIEILTRVLPETNRASDAPFYLQRLYTLDPYAAYISPSAPTGDQVAEQAVMVEHFNLDTSLVEVQAPEWTQNVGVQWEEPQAEDLPDWLNTLKPAHDSTSTAPVAEPPPAAEQETSPVLPSNELMPDFLKEAGWTQSDRRADDIVKESLMASGDEDELAAPGEIPDWLQGMAPQGAGTGQPEEEERTGWLDSILPAASAAAAAGAASFGQPDVEPISNDLSEDLGAGLDAGPDTGLPDWLSEAVDGARMESPEATAETLSSDTPDWMSGFAARSEPQVEADSIPQPDAEHTPDWLSQAQPQERLVAGFDETPDWLAALGEPEVSDAAPATDTPDWLNALGSHPNDTQMLGPLDDSFARQGSAPEAQEPAFDSPPAGGESAADVTGMPDWLAALGGTSEPEAPNQEADSTDWMAAFGESAEEATPAEGEALAADIDAGMPNWMQGLAPTEEEQAAAKSTLFETPEQASEASPVPEMSLAEDQPAAGMPDMNDMDATMAWLESLAARQGADEATLITPQDQRTETPPDWVQQAAEGLPAKEAAVAEESAAAEAAAAEAAAEPAEIPDWLADLAPQAQETTIASGNEVEQFIPGREMDESVSTGLPEVGALAPAEQQEPSSELAQPDFNDMDATMAWLEALAAKQGADEATLLITNPDQRSETPPDWVQQATEASATEASAAEETRAEAIIDPGVELPSASQPEGAAFEADLPDWLKGLDNQDSELEEMAAATPDAHFARVYDFPEKREETEPLWPIDSHAEDELAQSAAEASFPTATEPAVVDSTVEASTAVPADATMPDLSDMDAALAWLESLAAKQGADEATLLISTPEQRSETPPDWIQQAAEQLPTPEMTQPEAVAPSEDQPVVDAPLDAFVVKSTAGDMSTASDDAATLPDWLTSLESSAEQPADAVWPVDSYAGDEIAAQAVELTVTSEETILEPAAQEEPITSSAHAEAVEMPDLDDMDAAMAWLEALAAKQGADEATLLITDPEQRSETPPEWVRKQTGELRLPEGVEAPADESSPQASQVDEELPVQSESLPDWLQAVKRDEAATAAEKTQPLKVTPSQTPVTEAEPEAGAIYEPEAGFTTASEETAAWLESLQTGEAADLAVEPAASADTEMPETAQPGNEFMPQWLTGLENESETVEYAESEEETAALPVDISSAWVPEEAGQEPAPEFAAEPPALSLPDLQAALRRGDLDRALDGYTQLIQHGQMLEETIQDLRDALYRYPVDIMIWQTLGDAYSRDNQLQDALDAYTKAEELLR